MSSKYFFIVLAGALVLLVGYVVVQLAYISEPNPTELQQAIRGAVLETADDYGVEVDSTQLDMTIAATWITSALKAYRDTHDGLHPRSLDELIPDYHVTSIPLDAQGNPFRYRQTDGGRGYELCRTESDGQEVCTGR